MTAAQDVSSIISSSGSWSPIQIDLHGHIPSKKNLLRFNRHTARPYYDVETKSALTALAQQVERAWSHAGGRKLRPPLIHPAIAIIFFISETGGAQDRDNMWTTVLDALVAGGVIKDDNIEHFNRETLIGRAYVAEEQQRGCRVFIDPAGRFNKLWEWMSRQDWANEQLVVTKAKKRRKATGERRA